MEISRSVFRYFTNTKYEVTLELKIASRGLHFYGKDVWPVPRRGQRLIGEIERDPRALREDPFSVALKLVRVDRIVPDIVGHIPREISRFVQFFIQHGGQLSAQVLSERYRPSPIPKGGLEIILMAKFKISDKQRALLTRLNDLVSDNYSFPEVDENAEPESIHTDDNEENIEFTNHNVNDNDGEDDNRLIILFQDDDNDE